MAKRPETIHTHTAVNPERKYIRIQEVGLSLLLAMPVAPLLLALLGLYTEGYVFLTLVPLGSAGAYCLWYGDRKRQELRHNNSTKQ